MKSQNSIWKKELLDSITTVGQLKKHIFLSHEEEDLVRKIVKKHPVNVTGHYLGLIDRNNPEDPIRKMAIPSADELDMHGSLDTSGEHTNTKLTGLQHKYPQTALVLVTNKCYGYCRYCFRRRMVGYTTRETLKNLDNAARYVKKHKEITNVLISGGDPLAMPTAAVRRYLNCFSAMDHLDFIRIGTRTPVSLPNRIIQDKGLRGFLRKTCKKKQIIIVTHFSHPREISPQTREAIKALNQCGIPVNNQTVLLKGINDDPRIMARMMRQLVRINVSPYYIFQCRPVRGIKGRFQVSLGRGTDIINETNKMLDGMSKRFKFVMSHKTGKIEILGVEDTSIYLKYHQAKNPANNGRILKKRIARKAYWLDDLE